jgi:hypothetical protein
MQKINQQAATLKLYEYEANMSLKQYEYEAKKKNLSDNYNITMQQKNYPKHLKL